MILKCHDNQYRRENFSVISQHDNIIVNTMIIVRFIAQKHLNFVLAMSTILVFVILSLIL